MTAELAPGAPAPQQPASRPEWLALALAAATTALLAVLLLSIGPLGMFGLPLVGVPVARLAHRGGLGTALLATGIAGALMAGLAWLDGGARDLSSPLALVALTAGLPAFFSGLVRQGADPSREYLALAVSGCVLLGALLLLPPAMGSPSMGDQVAAAFDGMIPGAMASYSKANVDAETMARVKATLEAARDFSRQYWVGLVGAFWVLSSAVTFYTGARSARPAASAQRTRFEALSVPAVFAPLFVAAGAAWALAPGVVRQASGDVLLPLAALYFVAGLSIICHFARRWLRIGVLRIGLYALVVYFPMSVGVALLGLFDWYANFRRRGEEA